MRNRPKTAKLVVPFVLAGLTMVLAACSLILDTKKDQCTVDGDCAKFGSTSKCVSGVCSNTSNTLPDGATPPNDSGTDGSVLPDGGCLPKEPKSSREDFLNETCTDSKCIPFDDCARVGLCDGGRPPLVDPPEGGAL